MRKTISFKTSIPLLAISFAFILAVQILIGCGGGTSTKAVSIDKPTGKALYVSYCQICHGPDAHGDGPMAEMLKVPPPDLTLISFTREDGKFPKSQIERIIDGRERMSGHGEGDMPIWGTTFHESEDITDENELKRRIGLLVDYLESIQRTPE